MVRNPRKLEIDGRTYLYRVCRNSDVVLFTPVGTRHVIKFTDLTGLPAHVGEGECWDDWNEPKRYKTHDGVITKTQIADYVRARGL